MDNDADIIIVFGGTNDFGNGDAPFGEMSDRTPYTFYGRINADNYTVFGNSPIHCRAELSFKPKKITAYADEVPISVIKQNGSYYIVYYPKKYGDIRLTVLADGIHTYAEFYHSTEPDVLIKKRLYFIAEKQQYKRADSSLYGAYLVYDNVKKYPIFDSSLRNHNVCRKRVGMALLMCHWL